MSRILFHNKINDLGGKGKERFYWEFIPSFTIILLFFRGCPFTIAQLIVAIIIYTFQPDL